MHIQMFLSVMEIFHCRMGMGVDSDDLSSSDDEESVSPLRPQSSDDSVTGGAEAIPEINTASTSCSNTNIKTTDPHSNTTAVPQNESPVAESKIHPRQEAGKSVDADTSNSKAEIQIQSSSQNEKRSSSNGAVLNLKFDLPFMNVLMAKLSSF